MNYADNNFLRVLAWNIDIPCTEYAPEKHDLYHLWVSLCIDEPNTPRGSLFEKMPTVKKSSFCVTFDNRIFTYRPFKYDEVKNVNIDGNSYVRYTVFIVRDNNRIYLNSRDSHFGATNDGVHPNT